MSARFFQSKVFLFSLFYLVGLLSASTYADVKAVKLFDFEGNLNPVTTCVVGERAKIISTGPYDKTLRIWDFATGECEGVIGSHEGFVRSVATCVVDGEIKVIAGYDDTFSNSLNVKQSEYVQNTIRVWDLQTGECEQALRRHISTATAVATFVMDGKPKILSGSGHYRHRAGNANVHHDGDIHIWDMNTGKCEQTLRGHSSGVEAVATCIVDGKTKLVSASIDKTVRVWDAQTGICEHVLLGHENWIGSVASFTVDSKVKIVSGSKDGVVRIWDLQTGQCEHVLQGPESTNCMLASAVLNGELKLVVGFQSIFSCAEDSDLLTIWDLQTGEREHSLPMAKRFDSVFTFNQNGKSYIAMGFFDGIVIYF